MILGGAVRVLRAYGFDEAALARWCAKHGLEPFNHFCQGCGAPVRTTMPLAARMPNGRTLRGLACPPCPCGERFAPYAIVTPFE